MVGDQTHAEQIHDEWSVHHANTTEITITQQGDPRDSENMGPMNTEEATQLTKAAALCSDMAQDSFDLSVTAVSCPERWRLEEEMNCRSRSVSGICEVTKSSKSF